MKPALLQFPHISSYPVLMLLGFFFGFLLARSRARKMSIETRHVDNLVLILVISGLFGARFFARYFYMKTSFLSAFRVWEGSGLVFYGGFVFGALSVATYSLVHKLRAIKLIDCLAPSLALGLAFGRIGCFLGGCCWGDLCVAPETVHAAIHDPRTVSQVYTFPKISFAGFPLAVTFPHKSDIYEQHQKLGLVSGREERSLPVHPVQLYEAALAFLLCYGLNKFSNRTPQPGMVSLALIAGYGVIRFGTEFLRADNKPLYGGLTISQVISLVLLAIAFLGWIALKFQSTGKAPELAAVPQKPEQLPA